MFQNSLVFSNYLTFVDWSVFFLMIAITVAAVIYGDHLKKKLHLKTEEESFVDLLLMGRRLTLPLFIATTVATWYGGIFGVTQIAFEKGIFNFVTQGFFWYLTYILFAFFIVDKIRNYKALTFPELVGQMYGEKSSKLSAVFNFFNILPIAYAISMGLFLQTIFGGPFLVMMVIGTTFVILYSFAGGFRADVFSDLVQFFVMCISVFLVIVFSVKTFGGISFLQDKLPANYFSVTGGEPVSLTLIWGFIALSTLVDPSFYQRCFAADSSRTAKMGLYISTIIWFCFDICTTLGGMYAKAVIGSAESNKAYLYYAIQVLPNGLRGFFLAGILAIIISTMDSFLLIAASTLSYDLFPNKKKSKFSDLVKSSHISLILVGILCVVIGYAFDGNIKKVWKTLGSYWSACLLLPILYGYYFPKKTHDYQFIIASVLAAIAVTYWKFANLTGLASQIDELYIGILFSAVGLSISPYVIKKFKL